MAAGILPHKEEKLSGEGMEIVSTELLRCGGMKPVMENTGKSEGCLAVLLSNTHRFFSHSFSLRVQWKNI